MNPDGMSRMGGCGILNHEHVGSDTLSRLGRAMKYPMKLTTMAHRLNCLTLFYNFRYD
jgi:hypothetical protein